MTVTPSDTKINEIVNTNIIRNAYKIRNDINFKVFYSEDNNNI